MHLKIQKRNGREYLSIVQSFRHEGKPRTRTVETIGYADEYAHRYDDPIAHFREYVQRLNDEQRCGDRQIELRFHPDDVIGGHSSSSARLGAAIALGCLDALGVGEFFRARSGRLGVSPYDGRVFEMLATERMMHVTSKRESWTSRASFPRSCSFTFEQVYQALPSFSRQGASLESHLLRSWRKIAGGDDYLDCIYLVCGTYVFPTTSSQQSGGAVGSIVVALDGNAMPVGYEAKEGQFSFRSIRELADRLKMRLGAHRAVVIASSLRATDALMEACVRAGDGFVLLDSSSSEDADSARWVEDDRGYVSVGGGVMMKTRVSERAYSDDDSVPLREIVLSGGDYSIRRGYAVIATSEVDLPVMTVVQLFREIWRQAEPFQVLEADFFPTPIPISAEDHIRAHFAICYASFFALRLLRRQLNWRHNAADVADALLHMEGVALQQNYYLFSYRSEVTDDIESSFGLSQARRFRTRGELSGIPSAVCRSISTRAR